MSTVTFEHPIVVIANPNVEGFVSFVNGVHQLYKCLIIIYHASVGYAYYNYMNKFLLLAFFAVAAFGLRLEHNQPMN